MDNILLLYYCYTTHTAHYQFSLSVQANCTGTKQALPEQLSRARFLYIYIILYYQTY